MLLCGLASAAVMAAPPPCSPGEQGTGPAASAPQVRASAARFDIRFEPLGAGLWRVPARGTEADAINRGQVIHLVLARHEGRLWLLGSGPSPAFARALRCAAWRQFGLEIRHATNPYARAELVLGNAGLPQATVVAPRPVRQAMQVQCPQCVARLRSRLGAAAVDLGSAPVRLPAPMPVFMPALMPALVPAPLPASSPAPAPRHGAEHRQRWGPFHWWLVKRGAGAWTSAWRHDDVGVTAAFGLLWFDGPPDGRDTEPASMIQGLEDLLAAVPPNERFVGDAGPPGDRAAVQAQLDYWRALWRAAQQGVATGASWPDEPPPLPAGWSDVSERHRLNWQRAWRLAEDALLSQPPR